jgi:hypothetical protein
MRKTDVVEKAWKLKKKMMMKKRMMTGLEKQVGVQGG